MLRLCYVASNFRNQIGCDCPSPPSKHRSEEPMRTWLQLSLESFASSSQCSSGHRMRILKRQPCSTDKFKSCSTDRFRSTYLHIHIHIQVYIYIYTYIYMYTYTHIYTHIHIYIYTPTYLKRVLGSLVW